MSTIFIRKTGLVFRVHYGGLNPLDTKASKKQGGRWNKKNKYGAIYTSLDKKTLRAELYRMVDRRGITAKDLFRWKITVIEIKLKNVLNLTDSNIRKKYGIELSDILSDTKDCIEKCCKIADEARSLGAEAILSPSVANPEGKNFNIYPDKLLKNSYIKRIKTENLI